MKKKVLGLSIAFASIGLGLALVGGIKSSPLMVCAEEGGETTTEVVPTETEEPKQETSEISQICKDCIEFMKNLFSQPLVIGGVSTTIGALAILIISKAIGGISKKKLKDLTSQLLELKGKLEDSVSSKDYNKLAEEVKMLVDLCKEYVPTIKNINVRAECEKLLVELEPVIEETKEEIAEIKDKGEKLGSEVLDILKKE